MKFYSYSRVFPIDYNGSMKYQTNYQFERPFFLGSVPEIMKTVEFEKIIFNLNCSHQNN